MNMLNPKLIGI